jgi:hypothetical protein
MTTNQSRQAAFKARMRAAGLRQITIWVTPEQAIQIKALIAGSAPDSAPAAAPSLPVMAAQPVVQAAPVQAEKLTPAAMRELAQEALFANFPELIGGDVEWSLLVTAFDDMSSESILQLRHIDLSHDRWNFKHLTDALTRKAKDVVADRLEASLRRGMTIEAAVSHFSDAFAKRKPSIEAHLEVLLNKLKAGQAENRKKA